MDICFYMEMRRKARLWRRAFACAVAMNAVTLIGFAFYVGPHWWGL